MKHEKLGFKHLFKKLNSTLRYSSFPFAHHFERSFLFIEPVEPLECILFHCKCFLFLLWLEKLFSHSLQFHFQKNFIIVKAHFISCKISCEYYPLYYWSYNISFYCFAIQTLFMFSICISGNAGTTIIALDKLFYLQLA